MLGQQHLILRMRLEAVDATDHAWRRGVLTRIDLSKRDFELAVHGGPIVGVDEAGRGPLAGPVVAAAVVLDPAGERLWLSLRALDLPRSAIARLGFALCEVDPARDVEAFADELDVASSISAQAARDAIAPLGLPADYRAALLALDRRARPR